MSIEIAEQRIRHARQQVATRLDLSGLGLDTLPESVASLEALTVLDAFNNRLTELPEWIGNLHRLQSLVLVNNNLRTIPESLGRLNRLTSLLLAHNRLKTIPFAFDGLTSLITLTLNSNLLSSLPDSIGSLENLSELLLQNNRLKSLPESIGRNIQLKRLIIGNNSITELPLSLGFLRSLVDLNVDGNPITFPDPAVIENGTRAVVEWLANFSTERALPRWEAKLILVGQGQAGKSCLVDSLNGNTFIENRPETHGIALTPIRPIQHPNLDDVKIRLTAWDFGGQDIGHSTHRFFLTGRSLYLLLWDARKGFPEPELRYWLDTIEAFADDPPVLIVATHCKLSPPNLEIETLQHDYPNLIVGYVKVDNRDRVAEDGIDGLRSRIAEICADQDRMPHVGKKWNREWLEAEDALRLRENQHHITFEDFVRICRQRGISRSFAEGTLLDWWHDLGKLHYYRTDDRLNRIVVLRPEWITQAARRVFNDAQTRRSDGVLEHARLSEIWGRPDDTGQAYESSTFPVFLELMHRMDLCHPLTGSDGMAHQSLVTSILDELPPAGAPSKPQDGLDGSSVRMIFDLSRVYPGIITRFIARTYRYRLSPRCAWRSGVVLQHGGHYARLQHSAGSQLSLTTWGKNPGYFHNVLREILENILEDYKRKLRVTRLVPCNCRWLGQDNECEHLFDLRFLETLLVNGPGHDKAQCQKTGKMIAAATLLYGIHPLADGQPEYEELGHLIQQSIGSALSGAFQLTADQQLQIDQLRQNLARVARSTPTTFVLLPTPQTDLKPTRILGSVFTLWLICENPLGMHKIDSPIRIRQSAKWWSKIQPLVAILQPVLRHGAVAFGLGELEGLRPELKVEAHALASVHASLAHAIEDYRARNIADWHNVGALPVGERIELDREEAIDTFGRFLESETQRGFDHGMKLTEVEDRSMRWLCAKCRVARRPPENIVPTAR